MQAARDDAHEPARPVAVSPPLSGAQAREQVRRAVHACLAGQDGGSVAETTELRALDAQLACSELLSNARRHGGGLAWFRVRAEHGHVVIEVADHSSELPLSPPRDVREPGGFGWALVQRLAAKVVVEIVPDGTGKVVTAYLPVR
ncbi:ATP-binding protein [Streptomyces sp. SID8379]|uniref:ATP-binding protein n=1 Tax=unclassified Streptomyces TaxID=2593676 RepID=UPI00036F4CC3|nr:MULTISPECIES: ATP-binding protein [unclassified Streptomyces]MYW70095.1 ATP-binding protein [Streptomyces sp. SID8379]